MIRVIYSDKSCGYMEDHVLEEIKEGGKVVAYFGSDGWVSVKPSDTVSADETLELK